MFSYISDGFQITASPAEGEATARAPSVVGHQSLDFTLDR